MNTFLRSVLETKTAAGEGTLWWLGQMGLLIHLGEMTLCVDYYASDGPGRQFPPPVPAEEITGIDVFLGTHNHLDHIDPVRLSGRPPESRISGRRRPRKLPPDQRRRKRPDRFR